MALINQPGMFQGTPSLNPLPYVNIAMQARARKAAREEAIDKYYRTLPDTINDKGVRDNEVPIINDIKNKIFEFGLKNKEALKNPKLDNGASQLALDKLMREAQGVVRMSQDAAKTDLQVGKLLFSKDKEYILNSDEFVADHELHNLPVTDPNYKPINLTKYSANKPFDQDKFVKLLKGQFQYETKDVRTPDPTNPLYDNVEKVPILEEKTKENIYAFAADKLHNDFTFKRKIEKDLAGTGQLPKLQKISKEVFGKDIESDEDLAAAYTVSQLYSPPTKVESKVNTGAVMDKRLGQQKVMEGIRQANRLQLFGMREAAKAAGEDANDLWVETYIDRLNADAKNSTEKATFTDKGKTVIEDRIPIDAELGKLLTRDGITPDRLTVTPDGRYRPIFYKRDDKGVVKNDKGENVVDIIASEPISREQLKIMLGGKAGVKQKNKEMAAPPTKNNPTKKIVVKKGELDDLK